MAGHEPSRAGEGGPTGGTRAAGARGLAVAAGAFLAHGWLLYGSAGRDDVHITYWAAHSLLEYGEILNYNAVPYEQSSTLLHTLVLAVTGWLTSLPLATLGPVISIGAGLVTLWLVHRLAVRLGVDRPAYAPLLTALLGYFVYWSFSGMETSLAAALVVASVLAVHRWLEEGGRRRALVAGGAVCAYVAVRPESGLVLAAALVGYMLVRRLSGGAAPDRLFRREVGALAGGLLAFGGLALWRLTRFGLLVPGPVAAKVPGVDAARIVDGLVYLHDHAWIASLAGLALAATAGLIGARRQRGRVERLGWLASAFVVAYLAFAVASGGDWMEGGRLLVPALPLVVVLAARGLETLAHTRRLATGALALTVTLGAVHFAARSSVGYPGPVAERSYGPVSEVIGQGFGSFSWWEKANRVHLRDIPPVLAMEDLLRRTPRDGDRPTVWSIQGGMVFYHLARRHAGRLEFVDLVGLTTPHLHDCPIIRGRRGTRVGLVLPSYEYFLASRDELHRRCGVPRPDVVVDLLRGDDDLAMLRRHGFRIVYRQEGAIEPAYGFLGALEVADAFIAVRAGWLEGGAGPPRVLDWPTGRSR